MQSDPIGLDAGTNTFGYVLQSPMTLIDPLGLFDTTYNAGMQCGLGLASASTCMDWFPPVPPEPPFDFWEEFQELVGVGDARKECEAYSQCVLRCLGKVFAWELAQRGALRLGFVQAAKEALINAAEKQAKKFIAGGGYVLVAVFGYQSVSCSWKCTVTEI